MGNRRGIGWNRSYGELKENDCADFLSLLSFSLFSGKHTTTYKFCFLKSILDNIYSLESDYSISFKKVAETFCAVYWNMICVYKMPQMPAFSSGARSVFERVIEQMISEKNYLDGVHFESIKQEYRELYLKNTFSTFEENVIGAFYEDVDGKLYGFSKKEKKIWFNENSYEFLSNNKIILEQVNYYEWLKMIENILKANNKSIENLSTILEEITKRRNLSTFRDLLIESGEERRCFYCEKELKGEIHVDHVIPWDYLKSDNVWNFVLSCPKCNISKNNKLPDESYIDKLIERNNRLGIPSPDIKKIYMAAKKNGYKYGWIPKR